MAVEERVITSAQNSLVRAITYEPRAYIAGGIEENTNWTADDLSAAVETAGLIGGGVATVLNTYNLGLPGWARRSLAGLVVAVPILIDCLDGPLATREREKRLKQSPNPEKARYSEGEMQRSVHGGGTDYKSDRRQELYLTLWRDVTAILRGSMAGHLAACEAGESNQDPSEARAEAELDGVFVEEMTFGPGFFGNRVGRGIAAVIAVVFPEAQPVMDKVVAESNKYNRRLREEERRRGVISPFVPSTDKEKFDREVATRLAPIKLEDAQKMKQVSRWAFTAMHGLAMVKFLRG